MRETGDAVSNVFKVFEILINRTSFGRLEESAAGVVVKEGSKTSF